jgi:hypothetical protein
MMTESLTHQPTLKELKKAILEKAQNGNLELKKEFYSIDAEAYEFVDVNVFDDHKLLLFRCPKSKSTVSLILFNKTN